MINIRAITLTALVAIVTAQNLSDLSAQCNSTLSTISSNPEVASCIGLKNLEAIAVQALSNSSSSLVPSVDAWITGVCGTEICTEATLKAIAQNLTVGCEAEIPEFIITDFPVIRNVICLKEGPENCITQTLNTVEIAVGSLNVNNIGLLSSIGIPENLYTSKALCTECNKAILITIARNYPEISGTVAKTVGYVCDASYNDGVMPANINVAAAATTGNGSAAGVSGPTSAAFDTYSMLSRAAFTALVISNVAVFGILA